MIEHRADAIEIPERGGNGQVVDRAAIEKNPRGFEISWRRSKRVPSPDRNIDRLHFGAQESALGCVDVCAAIQQQSDDVVPPASNRVVQGRAAIPVAKIDVGWVGVEIPADGAGFTAFRLSSMVIIPVTP